MAMVHKEGVTMDLGDIDIESATREDLVVLAKIAEAAQRYDDMRYYMYFATKLDANLDAEERNMVAVSYKNSIASRRRSWRNIGKIEARWTKLAQRAASTVENGTRRERESSDDSESATARNVLTQLEIEGLHHFKKLIKSEIYLISFELINLLRSNLLKHAEENNNHEAKVHYLKLIGDYYRYLTEMTSSGEEHKKTLKQADKYYSEALPLAEELLDAAHPCRLGLVLNVSVFWFEILKKPDKACQLAKKGYDLAITEVDNMPHVQQTEAKLIMDLLRQNIKLWTAPET